MINTRREWDIKDYKNVCRYMKVCENHFEASHFMCPNDKGSGKKLKKLMPNAIPTLFPKISNPPSKVTPSRPLPQRTTPPPMRKKQKTERDPEHPEVYSSPNPIDQGIVIYFFSLWL